MTAKTNFRGSFTALVTPFKNGAVDEQAFRGIVDWQITDADGWRITDGIEFEKKALEVDPEYENAMAYMNLLIRFRADLLDSKDEYQAAVKLGEAADYLVAHGSAHLQTFLFAINASAGLELSTRTRKFNALLEGEVCLAGGIKIAGVGACVQVDVSLVLPTRNSKSSIRGSTSMSATSPCLSSQSEASR